MYSTHETVAEALAHIMAQCPTANPASVYWRLTRFDEASETLACGQMITALVRPKNSETSVHSSIDAGCN